jgi:hypothetical protein
VDLDALFPDDLLSGDPNERFFDFIFNGDREVVKKEILALLDLSGDPTSKMIEIMARIASQSER